MAHQVGLTSRRTPRVSPTHQGSGARAQSPNRSPKARHARSPKESPAERVKGRRQATSRLGGFQPVFPPPLSPSPPWPTATPPLPSTALYRGHVWKARGRDQRGGNPHGDILRLSLEAIHPSPIRAHPAEDEAVPGSPSPGGVRYQGSDLAGSIKGTLFLSAGETLTTPGTEVPGAFSADSKAPRVGLPHLYHRETAKGRRGGLEARPTAPRRQGFGSGLGSPPAQSHAICIFPKP